MEEYNSEKDGAKDSTEPEASEAENEHNGDSLDEEALEGDEPDTQDMTNDEDSKGNNSDSPEMESHSENDRKDEWQQILKHPQPPNDIIRDCLTESFANFDDVSNFCFTHFESFSKELQANEGFKRAIVRLIEYCKTHGEIERLWSYIESKRKNHYNRFYPKWKQAIENVRRNQNNAEHSRAFDPIDQYKSDSVIRENVNNLTDDPHPLFANDLNEINLWFFDELDAPDQSRVLTVALFEGISRKHIEPIAQEIERKLFEKQ